jgi:hypothetical protein
MNQRLSVEILAMFLVAGCGGIAPTDNQTNFANTSQQLRNHHADSKDDVREDRDDSDEQSGEDSAETGNRQPARLTYEMHTTDSHDPGTPPTWKTRFKVDNTITLFFATDVHGRFSGHHKLTAFVYAPGNSLYQRFDVSFAAGVPAGQSEQSAERTRGGYRVWLQMPVAGTWIQQYQLTGKWSASSYVDGSPSPNAGVEFILE